MAIAPSADVAETAPPVSAHPTPPTSLPAARKVNELATKIVADATGIEQSTEPEATDVSDVPEKDTVVDLPSTAVDKENGDRATESLAMVTTPGSGEQTGADAIWRQAIAGLDGMTADCAAHYESAANFAPNRLVVTFPATYNSSKSFCERPERRDELQRAVAQIAGRVLKLEFTVREDAAHRAPPRPARSSQQMQRDITSRPIVQKAMQLFTAEVVGIVPPRE